MKKIYFITIGLSILLSQNHIDALIQDVLHGSRDSVAIFFPMIEQEYPNNPSTLYLKGLLEIDGEKAKNIFLNLYDIHPTSNYGDDAVMKVAEYYYVAGLYVQAADWLKKMPTYYSRSEHIGRAIKLFLNSLIVSGLKDTAIYYSRVFERQFPELTVNEEINNLLQDYEKSIQEKDGNIKQMPNTSRSESLSLDSPEEILTDKNSTKNTFGVYSLQIGAYSIRENAELQKENLIISGFDARITELYRNNKVLYVVKSGYFKTKDGAREVSSQINIKLNIRTIVITNR